MNRIQGFSIKICNSGCEEPQTCPLDPGQIQRRSPSRGPTEPRGPGPGKQPLGVSQHTPKHPAPDCYYSFGFTTRL
ncbi:hypothetical protein ATANTOWER_023929 [Ataeniobius toweri]|uniref:Uncharacterized protein n=1 Tax=Ataeniobius toweri TaxID=208326 RepID=A0ABU7CKP1_9TELE|nr:hypothetical protein [Ataeniobius toweri]